MLRMVLVGVMMTLFLTLIIWVASKSDTPPAGYRSSLQHKTSSFAASPVVYKPIPLEWCGNATPSPHSQY